MTEPNPNTLKLHLIGAVALLGRISGSRLADDENYCIARAINDLINLYPGSFTACPTSGGGWSLEVKRDGT